MKVLVIAPHPDDEVLGMGGTIAKRNQNGHEVYICIVTKGYEPLFSPESVKQVRGEVIAADKLLGVTDIIFLDFPAVMVETVPRYEVNAAIANVINEIEPDEVYIPHRGDMQIDHQLVVDAAMVGLRPKYRHNVKRIYAYETMSETGWNIPNTTNEFIPTVYEDITQTIECKLEAMKIINSQVQAYPNARSLEALEALAKYRGSTVNLRAAEAFELIRELR